MLNLVFGFFNKYILYIIAGATVVGVIGSVLLMWQHTIKQEAQLEFNNLQLQQVIEQQQKFMANMEQINNDQKAILDDLSAKNTELQSHINNLEVYLTSDQANRDSRPSSTVLKNTIKQLGLQ